MKINIFFKFKDIVSDQNLVIARNSIEQTPRENLTNNLNEVNYDPFFHKSKLRNNDGMMKNNNTSSWMDDRVCILNYFLLFFAFLIVMIILVLVVGISFAN